MLRGLAPDTSKRAMNCARATVHQQVFPDEFHLQTLETLLAVCPQLQPNVKVGGVLAGLMTRLAKYAADVPEVQSHRSFCLQAPTALA